MNKRIQVITAAASALFLLAGLCGCGDKDADYGNIEKMKSPVKLSDETEIPPGNDTSAERKTRIRSDYYSGYSYEYPADYRVDPKAANRTEFTKAGSLIEIQTLLITPDDEGFVNPGYKDLEDLFEAKLLDRKINTGNGFYKREAIQPPYSSPPGSFQKTEGDTIIFGQDFENLAVRDKKGSYDEGILSERRYYTYEKGVCGLYSLVCEAHMFGEEKEKLDRLVTSRKRIAQSYDRVFRTGIKDIDISIPSFYKTHSMSGLFGGGRLYRCPPDSNNALAGSFIGLYDTEKPLSDIIDKTQPSDIFLEAFGKSSAALSENLYTQTEKVKPYESPLYLLEQRGFSVRTYRSDCTVLPVKMPETELLDIGSTWEIYIIEIEKGKNKALITMGCQSEKYDSLLKTAENMIN